MYPEKNKKTIISVIFGGQNYSTAHLHSNKYFFQIKQMWLTCQVRFCKQNKPEIIANQVIASIANHLIKKLFCSSISCLISFFDTLLTCFMFPHQAASLSIMILCILVFERLLSYHQRRKIQFYTIILFQRGYS